MRFGLFYEHQLPRPWEADSELHLFQNALDQVELADRLGIDYAWEVEHHFLEEYSHSSAPEVFLAACSQRTTRIRLGHGIVLMPPGYNQPARVAERIATLDLVSRGRVDWGTGESASRAELEGYGVKPADRRAMWRETVEQVANMMVMNPYPGFQGQFFSMPARNVVPKPVQKPHPPLFTGGTSDITYKMAGERGWGIFVPPLLPWKVLEPPLKIYKDACAASGHQPNIVYIRPVYIDEDEKQIRKEVEQALYNFLAFNASPVDSLKDPAKQAELRAKGYGFYASGALESLTKLTYDEIVEQEIGFIGTPEKVISQVRALEAKGGIGELAIVSNFGGLEHWKSIKTQELFAKHVIPKFR